MKRANLLHVSGTTIFLTVISHQEVVGLGLFYFFVYAGILEPHVCLAPCSSGSKHYVVFPFFFFYGVNIVTGFKCILKKLCQNCQCTM